FCLSPVEEGMKPLDCLCHGKPGTGKTVLIKYVLQQLSDQTSALTFYVNCWENKTLNLILDRLVEQAEIFVSETKYSVKISRLKRKIGNRPCVIALDEVDKLESKELNDILYMLKNLGKVGLICVSNTRKYILNLDPRITSRIRFRSVNFPPYSDEELLTILKHRVIDCRALFPDTYSIKILRRIADLAAGDARIAIQTLRYAAFNAEREGKRKIDESDVKKGFEEVKDIKRKYMLEKLGEHHRLIYEIIKKNPRITSGKLRSVYIDECKRMGFQPKSPRTLNNYLSKLIALHHIRSERASLKGNVRIFRAM
ncbi:MAG: Cdc6/Cdc18 family protein, partial [Candidatus Hodarchaeales archaeon]